VVLSYSLTDRWKNGIAVDTRRIELCFDDVSYALTSVETEGGIYAFWYCQTCAATGTPNVLAPDSARALEAARKHLAIHHCGVHGGRHLLEGIEDAVGRI
jgi:hypothetical protein